MKDGKSGGSFKGSAGVRAFHSIDAVDEEDLLKWESLQFDEIQGSLEPFNLSIHQVALNDVYSRIVVRKDGTLNLQNLVEKKDAPAQAVSPPVTPVAETPKTVHQRRRLSANRSDTAPDIGGEYHHTERHPFLHRPPPAPELQQHLLQPGRAGQRTVVRRSQSMPT